MGGYSFAHYIHVSGPVAMAVAGLVIGNAAVANAMSDTTQDYLLKFWALIDEILNAVLFLLIGLEVIAIAGDYKLLFLGLLTIPLVIGARILAVGGPLVAMRPWLNLGPIAMPILVWGGLRGGISVALALSLPEGPERTIILAATYLIVLFAVIIQGGSVSWLIAKMSKPSTQEASQESALK
jgi:CPA1 family monovalent cation:H+ antiporter